MKVKDIVDMAIDRTYPGLARRRFCIGAGASMAALLALPGGIFARPIDARRSDLIGRTRSYVTNRDDTLLDMAREFGLGYTELVAANPDIDPWLPGTGVKLVLPTGHLLPRAKHEGLVLSLTDQRVYYFPPNGGPTRSMPVGIGRQGWTTPLGRTLVTRKKTDPTWFVPKSIRAENPDLPRAIGPGPNNPLGKYALYLGWPSYLLHGTNQPSGVGRRVSHGCVRLYPEDIEQLYKTVAIGTPVTVLNQEAKIGWHEGNLLLEVHPSQDQADRIEAGESFAPEPVPELEYLLIDAAGGEAKRLNWPTIRKMVRERRGVPEIILTGEILTQ
jgi:L,D-transpeptidase ErfK/SrfK